MNIQLFSLMLFSLGSKLCCCFSICLLTNSAEMKRKTNTGELVSTVLSSEQCILLEWNGRDDNERVEAELQSLRKGKSTVLLWTDRHDVGTDYNPFEIREGEKSLYIVIDATWQEAKTMLRRGPPILRSLIRLPLREEPESRYLLRKDYGYKKKFGERGLMCTAEVCAALMKREGFFEQAQSLYHLLDELQRVPDRSIVASTADRANLHAIE